MHFSYSHWKKACTVDTHMYFSKHSNVPDKVCHCRDLLLMLVMFCCLAPLTGSAATRPGLEIHP